MKWAIGLLVLAILNTGLALETVGSFTYIEHVDPMTDEDSSFISTLALDDGRRFRTPNLAWRCYEGAVQIVFSAEEFLGIEPPVPVRYRFDKNEPSAIQRWGILVDNTSAWIGLHNVPPFTAQALAASQVVMQATAYDQMVHTSTFNLEGLAEALSRLSCAAHLVE